MKKIEDLHYKNVYYFENKIKELLYGVLIFSMGDNCNVIGATEYKEYEEYHLKLKNGIVSYIDEDLISVTKKGAMKKYELKEKKYLKKRENKLKEIVKKYKVKNSKKKLTSNELIETRYPDYSY